MRSIARTLMFLFSLTLFLSSTSFAEVFKIADGVFGFTSGNGYFSMFVLGKKGVVAIEPVNSTHAKAFVEGIRSVTEKPIRLLLHSHNHWDHSGGGQVFRDEGAKIAAHRDAVRWMKENPHPDIVVPDKSWKGKKKKINLGDRKIELHHVGVSHGLGMTVFLIPDVKVAYIADLVTPERVLFTVAPDFNIAGMITALSKIEGLDFERALYSHSVKPDPMGTKMAVTQTREFIQDLQAAIGAEFAKGTPFLEIPGVVRVPKYESWAMYKEWLSLNAWKVMLEMAIGPYPSVIHKHHHHAH